MNLTKAAVARLDLEPGTAERLVFDDDLPGFGIRIRAGGSRTWFVQYRLGAKQRRLKLGSVSHLLHDQARQLARQVLAKVALGQDPQREKADAHMRTALTLDTVARDYLAARQPHLRPRSYLECKRHLNSHWLPLHGLPLADVTRADVAARLRTLAAESGPVGADRSRATLSALFEWSIREGLVDANPVAATNKHAGNVERERVLTDAELRDIWHACRDDDYGTIVRLLMLIPARRTEIGSMANCEVDEQRAVWVLPAQRSKNHRASEIPLTDEALRLIGALRRFDSRQQLFGRGRGGYSGWSRSKAALDARILAARRKANPTATVFDWRLHDLRRTISTRLHDLGVQPHVVEALLNHYSGHRAGVAGVYNRASYDAEKRAALALWEAQLLAIVGGGIARVVPLRAA